MAEFENESLGVKFSIPDKPTIRQQLAFRDEVLMARGKVNQSRMWAGSLVLFEEWECELIPDPKLLDLDVETNPKVADILTYVSGTVADHMNKIGAIPKND